MTLSWLPAQLLVIAVTGLTQPIVVPDDPTTAEPATAEVLRVKRDFGKPNFDLVIDAWVDGEAHSLRELRLWWTNTEASHHRKPLGRMIERMVQLQYRRLSDTVLTVAVAGDGKRFTFTVELDADGKLAAYVPIDTEAGLHIARCRTDSARLLARRVLGLPVGISYIAVTCHDSGGAARHGKLSHQELVSPQAPAPAHTSPR